MPLVLGGIEAGVDFGIGQTLPFDGSNANPVGNVTAHAASGGVMSVLRGGKFGHGFVSAGLSAAIDPHLDRGLIAGTIQASILGGSISRLTGGKFANGALSAAFEYAFNDACSRDSETDKKMAAEAQETMTGLDHAVKAPAEMDGEMKTSESRFFNGKEPLSNERLEFYVDGHLAAGVIECTTDNATRVAPPSGNNPTATLHNHTARAGNEYPGIHDGAYLNIGPVYFWTPTGALRVVEVSQVGDSFKASVRTVIGPRGNMSWWHFGDSDLKNVRHENGIH